jgi:hypothetical protein
VRVDANVPAVFAVFQVCLLCGGVSMAAGAAMVAGDRCATQTDVVLVCLSCMCWL